MLINKLGGIVDLVVDDNEEVILRVVLRNVLIRVFLGHCDEFCFAEARLSRAR